jgi:hypothetical protein
LEYQNTSVHIDYCRTLENDVKKGKPCDIDMYFIGKAPGRNVAAASASIAGQGEHLSDCNVKGKFQSQCLVSTQDVSTLTKEILEPEYRKREWSSYFLKEHTLFSE